MSACFFTLPPSSPPPPPRAQNQLQVLTAQQQEAQLRQQLEVLAASPFGDSPLFRSAISVSVQMRLSVLPVVKCHPTN